MHTALQTAPPTSGKLTRPFFLLLVGILLFSGLVTLAASWIPFSVLAAKARAMSAHGDLQFFDQSFYRQMQFRLRVIGLFNVALATLGFLLRNRICRLLQQFMVDSAKLWEDCKQGLRSISRVDVVGLFSLTSIAAILRFPLLFQPMRGDETYTFLAYASHPFYVGMSFYGTSNNHVFHTLLVRISYVLLGNHPWAFRQPVFWAGLLLVPATYIAGRCLHGRECGLLAAGLVASSSFMIEYSTNARGHILTCLEFVLLIPVAAYAFRRHNSAAWALFAALGALGFYTVPLMLYPFGGIALWLLLSVLIEKDRAARRRSLMELVVAVSLAACLTLELYSPVFAVSGPGSLLANKLDVPKPLPIVLKVLPTEVGLLTWEHWNTDIPLWLSITLAAGFLLALVFHRRLGKQAIPLGIVLPLWVLTFLLVHRVIPPARTWLFVLPLYFIVASAGCAWVIMAILDRMHIRSAIVVVAIVVCVFLGIREKRSNSVYLSNEGRGMEQLAVFLGGQLKPGDSVVAVVPSDTLLFYHFKQHRVPLSYLNAPNGNRVFVVVDEAKEDTLAGVLKIANRGDLEQDPSKLVAKYETADLYEISVPQRAAASGL